MASNGPPVLEHLLTRVRRWLIYFTAGRRFWPLNHDGIDAERPPSDRVLSDDQEDEEIDVVGLDDVGGLQEVEIDPQGGYGGDEGVEHARVPSPPSQQIPPFYYGMEWQQQDRAVPFPAQYPLPYSVPYAVPFAVQYPALYPALYAVPLAGLNPVHYTYPYAFPYAVPAFPQAFPFAYHYVFPHAALYAAPHPFPYPYAFPQAAPALPLVFPFADPYAFPRAVPFFPYAVPFANPYVFPHDAPDFPFAERYAFGEDYDIFEMGDDNGIEIPELDFDGGVGSVENIGPLSREDSLEEFSFGSLFNYFQGVPESPSTSGLSSSTRRRRTESNGQEAAAKRPRWSDESDTD